MDKFEQQSPVSDAKIEKTKKSEAQNECSRESILHEVVSTKQTAYSLIEAKARTVQKILSSLEINNFEYKKTHVEDEISNPEEILNRIRSKFDQSENPGIDDISQILLTSELEIKDVQSWIAKNNHEIQLLFSSKNNLEQKRSKLLARQAEEEQKNFFTKFFRGKERLAIYKQLSEVSHQTSQIETTLEERGSRGQQIQEALQKISDNRQELAINAVEQLFKEVVKGNISFKEKLSASEVKEELNKDLIAQIIMPELKRLQIEGIITKEDAEEYLDLLKIQLSEGSQIKRDDSIEKKEAIDIRIKRVDELNKKSGYSLRDIYFRVSGVGSWPADIHYDTIFDFLTRELAREQVEQLYNTLGKSLSPELQIKLGKITEGAINSWQKVLDLNKLSINEFDRLNGLERWQVVKKFAESPNIIPRETFLRVEKIIIQRLFDERLFPGGCESSDGTVAVGKMSAIGNPEALPLMLRHIEVFGSGHTSNTVANVMKKLLKKSSPFELQQVLESLPRNKKILLEILANENSYINRFSDITSPYFIYDISSICKLLQNGNFTIVREQLTKVLEQSGQFTEEEIKNFYISSNKYASETLELFLKARVEVEKIIIDSKLSIWTQAADKLLVALINPHNGESVTFPKRIVQEGLGIVDKNLGQVLDKIFETKNFKENSFEREAFLDGIILLNSKENGKVVLETLLEKYRGARNDPSRMRRIFQLLSTLDSFGEYEFVVPSYDEISMANQKIFELQKKYLQMQNKAERKKIKNKIESLTSKVQNLSGLKGIEDVMTQKVVEVSCKHLGLSQEYRNKIENKLEELQKGGLFEIIPSLAGKYEIMKETEVKNLLRAITAYIVEGNFKSWRYSHRLSEAQLTDLTDEQKEFWMTTVEPVTVDVELSEVEKSRREDELKAVKEIIRNAKDHILEFQPNFDFSRERAQTLVAKVKELTNQMKFASSEDEKKRFVFEKRVAEAEAILVNGVVEIENVTSQFFTREKIFTQARELRDGIVELNLPLAGLDIEQIKKIFTVGDIERIIAYESDDALTLLKVGVEPQEACLSWRNGDFNECLLAYVADSNKKVLNVIDKDGRVVARSIIKLTNQRNENDLELKTKRKTLFVEKPYSLLSNLEVQRAFIRVLLKKAQGIDSSITFGKDFDEATLQVFEEEARIFGYGINKSKLDIFMPHSLNKYDYSDTFGGKITEFNRYISLEAVTFEKSSV